ncbi:hypothetical protein SAICODRAFT_22337 [Saitoella complicata NRRL Y-17804]|nr:uncharacterized protein SAICODRAFT_22337 [Saitoella complicata NRRL Y-17804]ODQ49643.1 hypothetical protein SAICODRAFT_22337 [Saitoella complicata NRRL Y-17804]
MILAPFFVLIFVLVFAGVGYLTLKQLQDALKTANEEMKKRNVNISSSGAKIGVPEVSREEYLDKTQKAFVTAMEHSEAKGFSAPRFVSKKPAGPKRSKSDKSVNDYEV